MKHIMIDFETLSTDLQPVVGSLGAVVFDPAVNYNAADEVSRLSSFMGYFAIDEQLKAGANISLNTLHWWAQSGNMVPALLPVATGDARPVSSILAEFKSWCEIVLSDIVIEGNNRPRIWCKGLDFDFAILKGLHKIAGVPQWFKYNDGMDLRTFMREHGSDANFIPHAATQLVGHAHNPVYDCRVQILQRAYFVGSHAVL